MDRPGGTIFVIRERSRRRAGYLTSVRYMRVEHSETLSDFPSLWIETRVDGVHRFDTFFNALSMEWYTCAAGDGPVLIRGEYPCNHTAEQFVKKQVDDALAAGRI